MSRKAILFESCCNAYRYVVEEAIRYDKDLYSEVVKGLLEDGINIYANKFYVVETLYIAYDLMHLACI